VGGNIKNSPITIGIPAETLPGIIEAATKDWRALTDQQKQKIDALQNNLGVNEDALRAFFATLGENEVPPDRLIAKLLEIAGHYKEALAQSAPGPNDGPEIAKVKSAAKDALVAGQLDRADELLEQLEKLQDAAIASAQLERAGTSAHRGQLAMSRLRYRDAAQAFADAAKHVPEERNDIRLGYLDQEAGALYRQGDERGDNAALTAAIERYRILLTLRPRERVPLEWARTQVDLGNALATLGGRESGTARLREAVAAYRAALEEYPRDRVPLEWATTQMDLGNALFTLGGRESGTARLKEAVAAYRAALEETTRDRVPLKWAMTQNNLGNALETLGERESGTARLEEAVAAYRAALEDCPRDRVPLNWAMTQMNLGNALETLGEREGGTARLEESVAAYRAALEERTRERVPLDWAMTQNNLGNALRVLGERENGTARQEALAAAVAAWEACLTVTASAWPPEWVQFVKTRRDETQAEIGRQSAK
jgi:tetratricopeptide (TPR) repeat protein